MSDNWFGAFIYAAGVIGFIGIAVFALRIAQMKRKYSWALRDQGVSRAAFLVAILVALAAAGLMVASLGHIGACLLGLHCGANRAAGWFSLMEIGVVYVAFELLVGLALYTARRYRAHEA